ncbi:MAG: hypothetical protein Ta2B_17690 [Termitinemataceae bacterium]|nr:MAG: hypothetical protein Ta2B_17690 [Termitinemataceae bacterium]
MLAVKGIYDGKAAYPNQPVSITGRQEVIITFLDTVHTKTADDNSAISAAGAEMIQAEKQKRIQEKLAVLESLIGLVPVYVDEDAIKTERLSLQ